MALNDVPLAGQTLAVTRAPINQNFTTINTAFAVNHVEYGLGDQGKHKFLQFPQQAAAPTTSPTELALYVKGVAGNPQMFMRRHTDGTEIDFTSYEAGPPGWLRLPNGLLVKWGISAAVSNTGTFAMPVSATIPVFGSAPFMVYMTLEFNGSSFNATAALWDQLTTTNTVIGYSVRADLGAGSTGTIAWLAIGI